MDKLKARLTAKLGPLPVWAWALGILALVLGYMYFTKTGFFGAGGGGAAAGDTSAPSGNSLADMLGSGGSGGDLSQMPASTTVVQPPIAFTTGNSYTAGGPGLPVQDPVSPGSSNGGGSFLPSYGVPTAQIAAKYQAPQVVDPYAGLNLFAVKNQGLPIAAPRSTPLLGRSSGPQAIG